MADHQLEPFENVELGEKQDQLQVFEKAVLEHEGRGTDEDSGSAPLPANYPYKQRMRRFISRRDDPLKHWKLSPVDIQSLDRWDDYTEAKNAMFFHTHTGDAPWVIIRSDDKKRARLNCIRYFLHQLDYPGKDVKAIGKVDEKIVLVPDTRYKEKTVDIGHD